MVPHGRARCPLLAGPVLLLLAVAGCELPRFQGPQIQNPPRGFLLQSDAYQQRRMFPEREVRQHIAWIAAGSGPYSGIYINAHPGAIGLDEVAAAQDSAKLLPEAREVTFSEVEPLTIDGRTAWGWAERLETPERGLDWVAYRTVVSYDTVSYAIEYYSGDPGTKRAAPDTLRTVLSSFAVGRTQWNVPLIVLLGGLSLLGVSAARKRRADKAARLRSITLASIEKEEPEAAVDLSDLETEPAPPRPVAPPRVGPPAPPATPTGLGPREPGPRGDAT